jgi:predicted Ser/Thr protein kinase
MVEATMTAGGRAIETWTVHCSECGTAVSASGAEGTGVCPGCGNYVRATSERTAAGPVSPAAHAPAPSDKNDSLVGTRLGPWRLERLVGRGGMGRVYEAFGKDGKGPVALKVLSEALAQDTQFVRRFQREGKVLAGLSHPHVVEVLDQGETDGRLWFAMEFVRGENLRRRIERGPLPLAEAGRIAGEIASALEYAHGRGVVHRDLKPENVLLGEDGRARLADFGLLRLARDTAPEATTRLTRTDVILGTYEYMAPEQRRGSADVDARADVFSLGVILYECLTGRLPLGRFPPASELVAGVPRAVDAVVNRALAPEPGERFAGARALADALRGALAGVPPAPPPSARPAFGGSPSRPDGERAEISDEEARFLGHVRLIATFDRVAGWFLIAAAIFPAAWMLVRPFAALPGLVLVVGGILLIKQANRLNGLVAGARESQIVACAILCVFFPFGTALGIYGLIVLAPYRRAGMYERVRQRGLSASAGRSVFHRPHGARHAPPAPPPAPPAPGTRLITRVEVVGPEARKGPGIFLRLLGFTAFIWTLYLALFWASFLPHPISLEFRPRWQHWVNGSYWTNGLPAVGPALIWTAFGLVLAAGLAISRWPQRHFRRGFGIAFMSFVVFGVDLGFLLFAAARAGHPTLWP